MRSLRRWWKRFARSTPEPPKSVVVQGEVMAATERIFRRNRNTEAVVYWAGRSTPALWIVTTCLEPEASLTEGSFETTAEANARVIASLAANSLELLAQVHSHPGSQVHHSPGDDHGALMPYKFFLSIVVPHYGCRGVELTGCGVHRFEQGRFRRLPREHVEKLFSIVPATLSQTGDPR